MPLWIVATPIGTLSDWSPRARQILAQASLIAAEDTRVTRKLLGAFDIVPNRLISVRAQNERAQIAMLLEEATEGDLVYVCDAGTPCVSDPGTHLVNAALEAGIKVLSVPGPSSLSTSLAASGFPASPSYFCGFVPKKGRTNWLKQLLTRPETLVVFEGPSRIRDLVERCALISPERQAAVCRELSKRHEEIIRAPMAELHVLLTNHKILKGEMVFVIGPTERPLISKTERLEDESHKSIAKALASRWGVSKREAYQILMSLDSEYL